MTDKGWILFYLGVGMIVGTCAHGDTSPLQLETLLREAAPFFQKSPTALAYERAIDSNRLAEQSSIEESPFSAQANVGYSLFQSDPNPMDLILLTRELNSWVASETLDFKLRSSLELQLTGIYNLNTYQQPILYYDPSDHPFQIAFKLSYDLIQGGADGLANANAYASAFQNRQQVYTNQSSLLQARIQFEGLLADLYVVECKLADLTAAEDVVDRTTTIGKERAKARTIAHKEYLNFVDLQNSFAQRIAAQETNRESLRQQLLAWGESATVLAAKLPSARLDCDVDVERRLQGLREAHLTEDELKRMARQLPSTLSTEAGSNAAQKQLRVAHVTNLPSLQPFAQVNANNIPHSIEPYDGAAVGLTFQWALPLAKGADNEASARIAWEAAQDQEQAELLQNLSRLEGLQAQIASQKNVIMVLERSLKNSRELLRTLDEMMRIGADESLNYTNAYINRIDTSQALFDAWDTLEKSLIELREDLAWQSSEKKP